MIERAFPHAVFFVAGFPVRDTAFASFAVTAVLLLLAALLSRRLTVVPSTFQATGEVILEVLEKEIQTLTDVPAKRLVPVVGALALFLMGSAVLGLVPGVGSPTRDLSVAAALAAVVFVSVHVYGTSTLGGRRYLRRLLEPLWVLLPFNVIGEITRTVALALRLFGNMLSGELLVATLFTVAGLFVPVLLQVFGLLIGFIQAYVFTLLSIVYIAAALRPLGSGAEREGETL